MLLVTFHGGKTSGSINNVYAYATSPGGFSLLTDSALRKTSGVELSELRAVVIANGQLYVANGSKATSNVLCFQHKSTGKPYHFAYMDTLIAATVSRKGHFETAIAHPFGLTFDGAGHAYVSNQDTNVVAQVALDPGGQKASLGTGSQSTYLNNLFPTGVFLDGTFVASQVGDLHDVKVRATPVPSANGGLSVSLNSSGKVQNSVRDVAIANGILFVCDEPFSLVRMYSLADGTYLGASAPLGGSPTHLVLQNGGLFAVAGKLLYWSPLPASVTAASLAFQRVALTPPPGNKIGGISFAPGSPVTVYVPFQAGTSGAYGGSIYSFTVEQSSPSTVPVFSNGTQLISSGPSTFRDTPEFVLYVADSASSAV
jgi:hypothetical protein